MVKVSGIEWTDYSVDLERLRRIFKVRDGVAWKQFPKGQK